MRGIWGNKENSGYPHRGFVKPIYQRQRCVEEEEAEAEAEEEEEDEDEEKAGEREAEEKRGRRGERNVLRGSSLR